MLYIIKKIFIINIFRKKANIFYLSEFKIKRNPGGFYTNLSETIIIFFI